MSGSGLLGCSVGGCLTWCLARVYDLLLHISPSCETGELLWMVVAAKAFMGSISEMTDREGRGRGAACVTRFYVFVCNV